MRIALALILLLTAGAALAVDQRLYVPGVPSPIGGTGRDQDLGVIGTAGGGGGPPAGCNGTIDLSSGCVMPMLR